jgi:hypothetical protein
MDISDADMGAFLLGTAERDDLELWTHGVAQMRGAKQVFVLIWELEAQVLNGGFWQYAYNSSGEGAPFIVAALKAIGAEATAALTESALDLIGETDWQDEAVRQAYVESLDDAVRDRLDDLDQAYYRYEDNLTRLLFAYVVKHVSDFPPPKGQG